MKLSFNSIGKNEFIRDELAYAKGSRNKWVNVINSEENVRKTAETRLFMGKKT